MQSCILINELEYRRTAYEQQSFPHLFINLKSGKLCCGIRKDSHHLCSISFVQCNERFLLDDVHQTAEHAKILVVCLMRLQKDLYSVEWCYCCLWAHSGDAWNNQESLSWRRLKSSHGIMIMGLPQRFHSHYEIQEKKLCTNSSRLQKATKPIRSLMLISPADDSAPDFLFLSVAKQYGKNQEALKKSFVIFTFFSVIFMEAFSSLHWLRLVDQWMR